MSEIRGRLFAEKKKLLLGVGAALLVIAVAVASFFAWQHFNDPSRADTSGTATRIVAEVAKIYDLPTDEEPSVAQMQDPGGLQGQEFYKKAQKGDYVLVYRKAGLAIIYREPAKKLINVDHVAIDKP